MGRAIVNGLTAILGLALVATSCSGSSKKSGDTVDVVCDAEARRCDGLNVKVCSEDGTKETIEETCLPTQTCSDGVCGDNACVPNTRFCQNGAVWKCDSSGGGSMLSTTCPKGQFCREDDGTAYCSEQACTPGQATCAGNVAVTCASDGSGPAPGGVDCSATDQGCSQGKCRDLACMSGMKLCQDGDVYLCSQDGTSTALLEDCGADEVCDGNLAACRPKVCEPEELGCDSQRVKKCNAYGSDWEGATTDCAATNEICVQGECKKQTCAASTAFCQDGDVWQCDSFGVGSTRSQTCTPQWYHCQSYPNGAYCASNVCQPGTVKCDGNAIKTCTDEGTLPTTGTACASDSYCDSDSLTCKKKTCEPYTYFCKDRDIYYCDYLGVPKPTQVQDCPDDSACQLTGNSGAACVVYPCPPSEVACLGNQIGTCKADGQTLSSVTSDCAKDGNVCGTDLKCAKTASDTCGVAEDALNEPAGNVIGDVILVRSNRKLTELQANLILASARSLRWVVYEQTTQGFVAKLDKVVANQTGTGFISSGPIDFTLKAGRTYALGVAVTGGNFIAYYDVAPFAPSLSFGSLLGRLDQTYASTIANYMDASSAYQIKISTQLP